MKKLLSLSSLLLVCVFMSSCKNSEDSIMIMEKSIEEAAFAPAETFTAALNGNIDVLMNTQTVVKETEVNNETGKMVCILNMVQQLT